MFGFHMSPATLPDELDLLWEFIGSRACQIFVVGPRNFHKNLDFDKKQMIIKQTIDYNAALVIHGAYPDSPWGGAAASAHNIKEEMKIADELGATGVIIHLSADSNTNLHLIDNLIDGTNCILWLETNAAKPTKNTFESPAKIKVLCEQLKKYNGRCGLCVDTAHIHAGGVTLTTYEQAHSWFTPVLRTCKENGIPLMIHLNDSTTASGSGKDEHAALMTGQIWGPQFGLKYEDTGINYIVQMCIDNKLVCILERKEGLVNDLILLCKNII